MRNFWIACTVLVICRMLAAFILPSFDDAFITYRYGLNLVSGHGLVYNPGEKIMGTTAPLFALISGLPVLLSIPVQKFFFFFNLICDLITLFLFYKYFFKSKKESLFFLFAVLFALDSMVNRISIGGMEADLFLTVSLTGLILYLNGWKKAAAAILAMAYFLRPEALILLFIICFYEIYNTRKFPVIPGIISLIVLTVPLICIYLYYGQLLPQSVIAKSSISREPLFPLLKMIFFPDPLFYIVFPLAVYGFISSFKKDKYLLLSGLWAISFGLAYIIKAPHTWSWYFFPVDTLQLLFACFGVNALLERFMNGRKMKTAFIYALFIFPVLVWTGVFLVKGRSGVEKNIYSELEKDFRNPDQVKGKVFFADDIGALGYFAKAYIYDNQKLVTPQAGNYKNAYERISHTSPDYLFLYTNPTYLKMIQGSDLSKKYSFVKRYAIGGEEGYPDIKNLNDDYKQDYLLFKRNP